MWLRLATSCRVSTAANFMSVQTAASCPFKRFKITNTTSSIPLTLGCTGLLPPYGTTENFPWGGAHAAADADAPFDLLLLVVVAVLLPLKPTMRTSAYPAFRSKGCQLRAREYRTALPLHLRRTKDHTARSRSWGACCRIR